MTASHWGRVLAGSDRPTATGGDPRLNQPSRRALFRSSLAGGFLASRSKHAPACLTARQAPATVARSVPWLN